jgi:hypothetical protein
MIRTIEHRRARPWGVRMFQDEHELDDAQRAIDDWVAGFARRAERARALTDRLGGLTVTAVSRDRLVAVTVDSNGVLVDVRLQEAARRSSARWTAQQIMATYQNALTELLARTAQAVHESVGRDSPEGRAVLAGLTSRLGRGEGLDATAELDRSGRCDERGRAGG